MRKRLFTIVIPFISWNVIYVLIFLFLGYNIRFQNDGTPMGFVPWLNGNTGGVFKCFFHWVKGVFFDFNASGSPANVPFWYLRDLICMFILTPFIYWLVKCLKQFSLLLVVMAWVLSAAYITVPYLFLRPSVLFFIMGSYFALTKSNMIDFFLKVGSWIYWVYGAFAIIDLLSTQYSYNLYIHRFTVLAGVIVAFKIALHMVNREQKPDKKLFYIRVKNTNFFIFAFHWILLYWLAIPLSKLYNGTDYSLIVIYFLEILLCSTVAITLGLLLSCLLPKTMRLLNGR